jgi:hypothetical protein
MYASLYFVCEVGHMKKVLILLVIFSSLLSFGSYSADRHLFIDGKAVSGVFDISYNKTRGTVSTGDINEGPTVSWVTNMVVGKISLPANNATLEKAFRSKMPVNISFADKDVNKTFGSSSITEAKTLSGGKYKIEYSFRSLCSCP